MQRAKIWCKKAQKNPSGAEERDGGVADRQGDDLANAGEYTLRHNACLRAIRDMIAAVAIGTVVIGDKEDLARTAMLNERHAVDVAELGADEETGADVLYERSSASRRSARSTALASARRRSAASPSPCGPQIGFDNTSACASSAVRNAAGRATSQWTTPRGQGLGRVAQGGLPRRAGCQARDCDHDSTVMESVGGISPPPRAVAASQVSSLQANNDVLNQSTNRTQTYTKHRTSRYLLNAAPNAEHEAA